MGLPAACELLCAALKEYEHAVRTMLDVPDDLFDNWDNIADSRSEWLWSARCDVHDLESKCTTAFVVLTGGAA